MFLIYAASIRNLVSDTQHSYKAEDVLGKQISWFENPISYSLGGTVGSEGLLDQHTEENTSKFYA